MLRSSARQRLRTAREATFVVVHFAATGTLPNGFTVPIGKRFVAFHRCSVRKSNTFGSYRSKAAPNVTCGLAFGGVVGMALNTFLC